MSACAEQLSVVPEPEDGLALRFYDVTSADGTRLRPGPTTRTARRCCSATGSAPTPTPGPPCCDPDCGVRVISWNHRGVGGSDRPADPDRVGHGGVRRGRPRGARRRRRRRLRGAGLVDRREHHVRARRAAPRPGHAACSRSPASPARRSPRWARRCRSPAARASRSRIGVATRAGHHRRPLTPVTSRLPIGPRAATCCGTAASCCRCPTEPSPGVRSGSS